MEALELIRRIRCGEDVRESEEALYLRVRQAVEGPIARRLTKQLRVRVDPEDVLHEAFLRALGALDLFEATDERAFFAFVYRIAKNLLLDSARRRSVANVAFAHGDEDRGPRATFIQARGRRPETQIEKSEWIHSLLDKLKPAHAEVIRLHRLEEKSFVEIAELWGKTPSAVQRFYHRAWLRFRELATEEQPREP